MAKVPEKRYGSCRDFADAAADNRYKAAVAEAVREHKPTSGIANPGPEPPAAAAACPPPAAYGIPASALPTSSS